MMSGGGLLPCLERHSLRPENGAELPRQFQSQHNLVCDQRLSTAKPGSQGLVFVSQPPPPPYDFRQQYNRPRFCPNIVENKITIIEAGARKEQTPRIERIRPPR